MSIDYTNTQAVYEEAKRKEAAGEPLDEWEHTILIIGREKEAETEEASREFQNMIYSISENIKQGSKPGKG